MPDITRSVTPDGELLVVEADSVEEAMAAFPEATPEDVLSVERVARGGVGGFFAREAFVVTLRPPQPAVHDVSADDDDWLGGDDVPERYVVDTRPTGLDAVIAQLAAEEDSKEVSFGALLQQHRQAPELATRLAPVPSSATLEPAAESAPVQLRHPIEARRPAVRAWTPPRLEDMTSPAATAVSPEAAVAAPAPTSTPVHPLAPAPVSLGELLAGSLPQDVLTEPAVVPAPVPVGEIPPPPGAPGRAAPAAVAVHAPPAPQIEVSTPLAEELPGMAPRDGAPARPLRATVSRAFRTEPRPAAQRPTPTPAVASRADAPVEVVTSRRGPSTRSGDAAWSMAALLDIGIPESLLVDLPPADPRDEYAWMRSLAEALSPLCRPLPSGPTLFAGPLAAELAASLDAVPTIGDAPFVRGDEDAAVVIRGDEAARSMLAHARGERWLHLVVGGGDSRAVRGSDPLAVSWVGDESLPEALTLASRRGLVLGYSLDATRGGRAHRAHPIDLSVAIRRLLPREGDR